MFWNYISTIWNVLTDGDREAWENFWEGMKQASSNLIGKANRFKDVTSLTSKTDLSDYYDIKIGIIHAKPMSLDPTSQNPNNVIKPIGTLVLEPVDGEYKDFIEISAGDYHRIRNVGIGKFVVIGDKYFKIANLLSSEEHPGGFCSFDITKPGCGTINIRSGMDLSNFTVVISQGGLAPLTVTWYPTGLEIRANSNTTVDDIVAAVNSPSGWGLASNKDKTNGVVPSLNATTDLYPGSAVIAKNLPNFIEYEEDSGRFYEPQTKVWVYHKGYASPTPQTDSYGYFKYDKMKYMIQIFGSLAYLQDSRFNMHLTTGTVFDVDQNVIDLPYLRNYIDSSDGGIEYLDKRDYVFYNNMIEFVEPQTEEDTFYCSKTPIIEEYLYKVYGTLVGVDRWQDLNHDAISGKSAVSGLMKFNQKLDDYEKSMNLYYGLPIAPENCEVVGLYESFGYKVVGIFPASGELPNRIRLEVVSNLHQFIYDGCEMLLEPETTVFVTRVSDRVTGLIEVSSLEGIVLGSKLYPKLINRHHVVGFSGGEIQVYGKDSTPLMHLIYMMSFENKHPEILLYDCEDQGVFHMVNATTNGTLLNITTYTPSTTETLYNDRVISDKPNLGVGKLHVLWPTHKFLYLKLESGVYYKAYLDAPIDTIFDTGDKLNQFDIICRNVSMKKFPGWNEFNYFRRKSGINYESDLLQLTSSIPGAKFGKHFPRDYTTTFRNL